MAINNGYPNPPFRTIAPIGAPMNKKTQQTNANVNFEYKTKTCFTRASFLGLILLCIASA